MPGRIETWRCPDSGNRALLTVQYTADSPQRREIDPVHFDWHEHQAHLFASTQAFNNLARTMRRCRPGSHAQLALRSATGTCTMLRVSCDRREAFLALNEDMLQITFTEALRQRLANGFSMPAETRPGSRFVISRIQSEGLAGLREDSIELVLHVETPQAHPLAGYFSHDDGTLPEIELYFARSADMPSAFARLFTLGARVGCGSLWDKASGCETPFTGPQDASRVSDGVVEPFHVLAKGINIDGQPLPDLGVMVCKHGLTLDYRMGPDWDAPRIDALLSLLRQLRQQGGQVRIPWWQADGEQDFLQALGRSGADG